MSSLLNDETFYFQNYCIMKKIIQNTVAVLTMALTTSPVLAQEFRSSYFMQTSNFRHQMNPALLDSAYMSLPFFGQFNVGTTGNMGLEKFVYKLSGNPKYDQTTFMSPTVSSSEFLGKLKSKNRADVYVNYNLFSVGFKAFQGLNLVELNARSNTNVRLPYELFEFMKTTGAKEHYQLKDIGLRSQTYLEFALGHTRKVNKQLTVGGKMKFLLGAAYADFNVEQLDVTMNGEMWRIQGQAELNAAVLKSQFSYKEGKNDPKTGRKRVEGLDDVSFSLPGFGMAFDLGAAYKINEDWTVSAGLTDLGFIHWSKTKQATSSGDYIFAGFNKIKVEGAEAGSKKLGDQFEDLGDDLSDMFSLYDNGEKGKTQALAATLNLGAEYTLPSYRPLRFGFLFTSRIHGAYSYHQGMFSVNIRPVKAIEASLNTTVSSSGWMAGAAVSFKAPHFNFYVGADRFLGKLSKQYIPLSNFNSNITFGMTIPF